ncbi:hypothetical protein F5Y11DRAFT_328750 [Daldinia sp. FL1419]|nr:hypothetical protein F5Y11DRAFT_328750 [Daldinia sp. FL1419]
MAGAITVGGIPHAPARTDDGTNIHHFLFPPYAPFDPYDRVKLHTNAYTPRELLNSAVKAFYNRQDAELSPRQLEARENFCATYIFRRPYYGRSLKLGETADFSEAVIDYLAHKLDDFFFFGLLKTYVSVESGVNVVGPDPLSIERQIDGDTTVIRDDVRGGRYIRIRINVGRRRKLYDLVDIIGQLMHEMVHAWFLIFSCDCEKCDKAQLNTTGVPGDGHGPIFLMLHRLILSEIRRWGEAKGNALVELDWDDCPDSVVSANAFWRSQLAIDDLGREERRRLNRVRKYGFSANHLIRITANANVAVRPNLKQRQLRFEQSLRTKRILAENYKEDLIANSNAYEEGSPEGERHASWAQPPSTGKV